MTEVSFLHPSNCKGRLLLAIEGSLRGAGQHVVGRLGLTGQGLATEPALYCLSRILDLGIQWEEKLGRANEVDLKGGNG